MLYPLRIDVTSDDLPSSSRRHRKSGSNQAMPCSDESGGESNLRIVDTILIDPTCLPIPPCPMLNNVDNDDLLQQTIERNSKYLARTLLADMEVHSCSRLHKAGRIKLFETYPDLEETVEAQIMDQLRIILEEEQHSRSKRRKKQIVTSVCSDTVDDNGNKEKNIEEKPFNEQGDLVKVNIRLRIEKILVVDEFWVDPEHPASNALFLAESIANDLNLPKSAINTLAISIAEQICGLEVTEDVEGLVRYEFDNTASAKAKSKILDTTIPVGTSSKIDKGVSSAWIMDEKEKNAADLYFRSELK